MARRRKMPTPTELVLPSREQESRLPDPGANEGIFEVGDRVRLHPIARRMLQDAGVKTDVEAALVIQQIIPREENEMGDAEAAVVRLPNGTVTVVETDVLITAKARKSLPSRSARRRKKKNPSGGKAILRRAMRGT
jgi:hypothetical protein